ncbi:MAG: hypothetical protein KAH10_00900 [Flavobacteriales bacterium]|nr:hypothetical protein [Flavobacteriales bacterium]
MGDYSNIGYIIIIFTGILFLLSLVLVLFIVANQKKKLATEILREKEKNQFQETLMTSIIRAQDDEKTSIGRELHDNINGLMMIAKLNIQRINDNTTDALKSLDEAMHQTRNLSHGLSFSTLETYGLDYTISQYLKRIENNADLNIKFEYNVINDPDLDISKQLFRILQEAVMNVNKYAKANNLRVEVTTMNDKLTMRIEDDGIGFDIDKNKNGIGLHNMELRAKSISSSLTISSKIAKGTSILVTI